MYDVCVNNFVGDSKKASTPKRRRSLHAEGSPTPGSTTPKTPSSMPRRTVPLSERQQMVLLKQMEEEESKHSTEQQQNACKYHGM